MRLDLKLSADSVFLRLFPEKGHTLALCFYSRTELFKLTMHVAVASLSVHTSCY